MLLILSFAESSNASEPIFAHEQAGRLWRSEGSEDKGRGRDLVECATIPDRAAR